MLLDLDRMVGEYRSYRGNLSLYVGLHRTRLIDIEFYDILMYYDMWSRLPAIVGDGYEDNWI